MDSPGQAHPITSLSLQSTSQQLALALLRGCIHVGQAKTEHHYILLPLP